MDYRGWLLSHRLSTGLLVASPWTLWAWPRPEIHQRIPGRSAYYPGMSDAHDRASQLLNAATLALATGGKENEPRARRLCVASLAAIDQAEAAADSPSERRELRDLGRRVDALVKTLEARQ